MTAAPIHIVFCADRRVVAGLHVAALSLLEQIRGGGTEVHFHVFSDDLTVDDLQLLETTLSASGRPFTVSRHCIDARQFTNLTALNGSFATYYRLLVPEALEVERFLYIDVDIVCDVDVAPLFELDLGEFPVAWVSQGSLTGVGDDLVARQLGGSAAGLYFNAGVMLVNVAAWRSQKVTLAAMSYLQAHPALLPGSVGAQLCFA